MAKRTDGGPAHPTNNRMAGEQGMSVRDMFAMTAPQVPLDFMPFNHLDGPIAVFNERFPECDGVPENSAETQKHRLEYDIKRMIAWRWAYADAMIAEREKAQA